VRLFHVAKAHTDGDAIVHFTRADVIHMGDVYFNGMYPFIDVESGGSMDGLIAAVDRVLDLCGEETRIIPGHGPLAGRDELKAYRDLLHTVRGRIAAHIEEGLGEDAVVAARPTRDFDAAWGRGFMKAERWVRIVYRSLSAGF
jgi:glyoxylase-like metal-dependent hydrolase (beta-lactamase superfamily II)